MNIVEIPKKELQIEFPSGWEECTPDQVDYILKKAWLFINHKISLLDLQVAVVYKLMGLKRTFLSRAREKMLSKNSLENKYANVHELSQLIDFIFVEKTRDKKKYLEFSYNTITNFFPELKIKKKILYGPATALTDISFAEYRFCCDQYIKFNDTEDPVYINRLIAALYRPERKDYKKASKKEDFNGSQKEKFNKHLIDSRLKLIEKLPEYQKLGISIWFKNCLEFLSSGVITVSGNQIDLGILYDKTGSSKTDDLGHTGTLFRLADAGTFGGIKETDNTGLYDILLKLYQSKKDYDELKSQTKTNQNDFN